MRKTPYSAIMLPTVNYKPLAEEIVDNLTDLEHDTMRHLCDFVDGMKEILLQEKMVQLPELIVAHLCGYLGFLTVAELGINEATRLQPKIIALLESQAKQSYEQFLKFLVNEEKTTEEEKKNSLETLRKTSPGSIAVQTARLGRVIFDAMEELNTNHRLDFYTKQKQTELFCPQDQFIVLLKKATDKTTRDWKNRLPMLYAINQTTIQLGWLMGYFSRMDRKPPKIYLEYGTPCVKLYIGFGDKFLRAMA